MDVNGPQKGINQPHDETHIRVIPRPETFPFTLRLCLGRALELPLFLLPPDILSTHPIHKLFLILTQNEARSAGLLALGRAHLGVRDRVFCSASSILEVLFQVDLGGRSGAACRGDRGPNEGRASA